MKHFGSLLLAAVIGSILTISINAWFFRNPEGVKIEYVNRTPSSSVKFSSTPGQPGYFDFTATAEKATKAVVHIKSTQTEIVQHDRDKSQTDPFQFFFGPNGPIERGPSQSSGSGVIINKDGYIVTNNHVVKGADEVEVTLADNRAFKAEVVGTDPDTDLAVIKISEKELPYLTFVNSDDARVGEWVLAVGNPFNLNSTVTAGIISAKGRNINIIEGNLQRKYGQNTTTAIESFIQTDAAINPGNSGGALVNLNGDLLGINTAIASSTGAFAGYGFAVPSNIVSKIVEDLLAYGVVQRGWLGVQVQNVTPDLVKQKGLTVSEGAYISGFAEEGKSAAKEAGLKEGDVVVKLDESIVKSNSSLIEFVGRKRPGDKVNVTILRNGKSVVIPVILKNKEGKVGNVKREELYGIAAMGMELEEVEAQTLKKLDLKSGVRVKALDNGKIERYTNMKEGFIITSIDNVNVKSVKQVEEILKNKKTGDLITFAGIYDDNPREYIYGLRI